MEKKETKFNQSKYIQEFLKENYDRVSVNVPKGRREVWKAAASAEGKSLNAFITDIIESYIASDVLEAYINVKSK